MKNILLIDCSNVIYRSIYANSALEYNFSFTGGIYGTFRMLEKALRKHSIDKAYACIDSKPYQRLIDYPNYKQNREKNEELIAKFNTSWRLVQEMFGCLGIPQVSHKGLEADDVIALLCERFTDECFMWNIGNRAFVLSNDSDLHQLVGNKRVKLIKKDGLYGYKNFCAEYPGLEPKDHIWITALAGSHNNVPGLKKVGAKTALKILNEYENRKEIPKCYKDGQHKDELIRNYKLARLPYTKVEIKIGRCSPYDRTKFIKFLDSLGIDLDDYMLQSFENLKIRK